MISRYPVKTRYSSSSKGDIQFDEGVSEDSAFDEELLDEELVMISGLD